jgi:hypothetical protein
VKLACRKSDSICKRDRKAYLEDCGCCGRRGDDKKVWFFDKYNYIIIAWVIINVPISRVKRAIIAADDIIHRNTHSICREKEKT